MAIRFLQQNTKLDSCSQTTIRFFTVKYKILQFYRNSHLVILQQNTKSVLKRPFVLWLRNTKFLKLFRNFNLLFDNKLKNLNFIQIAIRFFEIQNLKLYPYSLPLLNTNSENRNLIIYFYSELSKKHNKTIS